MTIAQLLPSLEVGGMERLAVDLAAEQARLGHRPHIFCVARRGPFCEQARAAGVPVTVMDKADGFSPATVWRLAREFRRLGVNIVHTHNAPIHHYGVAAARLAGIAAVVNTQHGAGALTRDRRLERIYRAALRWTKCVVCVSEDTRRYFVGERGVPEEKSRTIRNGIPLSRFDGCQARPGRLWPRIRFGTAGRLVPAKDHRTLLDAFARVRGALPRAELHLAGDGPLRSEVEAQVERLGLRGSVRLHGQVSDIPSFLADLDVFVLSSAMEALPIAVLEAMAAGLPIVSTRVAGVPEVAPEKSAAEYAPVGDAAALAGAMLAVAAPAELQARSRGARQASSAADIARTWRSYEALFRTVLDN